MKDLQGVEYNYMLPDRDRRIRIRISPQGDYWGFNISETGRTAEETGGVAEFGIAFSKAKERACALFDLAGLRDPEPADNASYLRLQIFLTGKEKEKVVSRVFSSRWWTHCYDIRCANGVAYRLRLRQFSMLQWTFELENQLGKLCGDGRCNGTLETCRQLVLNHLVRRVSVSSITEVQHE